jgi:hypothetical protein
LAITVDRSSFFAKMTVAEIASKERGLLMLKELIHAEPGKPEA